MIFDELSAISAHIPPEASDLCPPSDATVVSLWAEVRALRAAVAAEREACAAACEDLVSRFRDHPAGLPPPYPRSYLFEAARVIRGRAVVDVAFAAPPTEKP